MTQKKNPAWLYCLVRRGFVSCPREDLNLHSLKRPLAPQASASTNSATRTGVALKGSASRNFSSPFAGQPNQASDT